MSGQFCTLAMNLSLFLLKQILLWQIFATAYVVLIFSNSCCRLIQKVSENFANSLILWPFWVLCSGQNGVDNSTNMGVGSGGDNPPVGYQHQHCSTLASWYHGWALPVVEPPSLWVVLLSRSSCVDIMLAVKILGILKLEKWTLQKVIKVIF